MELGATPRLPHVLGLGALPPEAPFPGIRRTTYQSGKATITAYAFEPGATFPTHTHPEEQVTVVLEGDVVFTVEGVSHGLGAGETFVVAGGVEHGLRAGPAGAGFLAVIVPRRTTPNAYEIKGDA